jgi:hypothetical protein
MKFAALIFGTLTLASSLLALFLYFYGRRLPRTHRETASAELPRPPDEVWQALARAGTALDKNGRRVDAVTVEASAPRRLVRRLPGDGRPFSGTWTFELEPTAAGTRLTLTEEGTLSSPVYRAMAHLFIGMRRSLDTFLQTV